MSFASEYSELRKKRKKSSEELAQDAIQKNMNYSSLDIAPVLGGTPIKSSSVKDSSAGGKGAKEDTWFQAGAFDDGYQFGDVTKSVGSTVADAGLGITKGALKLVEGVGDLLLFGAGEAAGLFSDEAEDLLKEAGKIGTIDKIFAPADKAVDKNSFLGNRMEAVEEGVGQVAGIILTGGLAGAAGISATAATTGTMFASSMGSGIGEALNSGADDDEAWAYGAISGTVDAVSEMIFGGLGKGVNAIGLSKGLSSADDMLAKALSSKLKSGLAKNLVQFGVKASAEGAEEVIAGVGSALAKKMTYMSEEDIGKLIEDEKLLDQFIVGAVTSGIAQSGYVPGMKKGSLREANQTGRDFVTGLTANEQKVVDKEVENRIKEAKENGEKVDNKAESKIREAVEEELKKGYISTDTIEEVLGGDSYKAYRDTVDSENALATEQKSLQEEFNTLNKMKQGEMTGEQVDRREELRKQIAELKTKIEDTQNNSQRDKLKAELSEYVQGQLTRENGKQTDDYLMESYNERTRRSQAFEADTSKYDEKQAPIVQKAIDSGILNNSRRTHEFVDTISKIAADRGVSFDFTNNKKLKESGFAIDGKQVNGFVTKDGITINVQSPKAWQSTVGHEITHVLEGTELYTEMQSALYEYAKTKKDYDGRRKALEELYKDVEGADVDAELTADLVGDYLFQDEDFVKHLSTKNRNVFQKIYDEIKHLLKMVTSNKEKRELEKVKHVFDQVYRESGKVDAKGDTKYSLSADTNGRQLSEGQQNYFKNSKIVDENGNLKVMYHGTPNGDFSVFKDGTYFTEHKWYADLYQNPGASSISTGKVASSPKTFEVYLDIKKPFDISDAEARKIYINDYIKGGNAVGINPYLSDAEYDKITAIDWTEGEDLREFLIDNGYDYDGLVLDEGATGGYGEDVKQRGKSYVVFSSEQVKNTDNLNPTSDPDIRYSLSDSDGKKLTKEQGEFFKDSKMRDENGNLKVMYHGSQDAGFHVFDPAHSDDDTSLFFVDRNDVAASYSGTSETYEAQSIRTAEDMNKFMESIGAEGYEVVEKDGKFTLLYEGDRVAASNTAKGIYEEFCWYEGVGDGDVNYKVYLNLTNPLEIDAEGRNWNNISREFSQEVYDRYKSLTDSEKTALAEIAGWEEYGIFKDEILSMARAKANGKYYDADLASAYEKLGGANANLYDAFSIAGDNFSEEALKEFAVKQMNTRDYAAKAKAEGYDGVIFKNIHDNGGYSNGSEGASTVAIAFDSNQIKSVANEKPTGDPDIRYSLSADSKGRELSAEQKEFFKDTKIKDENGNLLVMYHGTQKGGFTVFQNKRRPNTEGFYFTNDKKYSDVFEGKNRKTGKYYDSVQEGIDKGYYNPETYEVYLDVKNPFVLTADQQDIIEDIGYWENIYKPIKARGYDGVMMEDMSQVFVFNSNQIKRVDNINPTSDPDIRYSLSPETDKTYLDAVDRGDMETAQRMVDDAAKNAGYDIKAYHGTPNTEFTVFDKERLGKGNDQYGAGFYFTTDKTGASHYGSRVIDAALSIKNPIRFTSTAESGRNLIDAEIMLTSKQAYEVVKRLPGIYDAEESPLGDYFDAYWEVGAKDWMIRELAEQYRDVGYLDSDLFRNYPNELHEALRDVVGYDGVEVTFERTGEKFYVAWFDNQMKSTDPVTYDDNGNAIPLSERFDADKNDIRNSLSAEGERQKRYGDFFTPAKELALENTQADIAPVKEDIAPAQDVAVDAPETVDEKALFPDDVSVQQLKDEMAALVPQIEAAMKANDREGGMPLYERYQALTAEIKRREAEDTAMQDERFSTLTDADVPPEVEAPYYGETPRNAITIDNKSLKNIAKEVSNILGLDKGDSAKMAQTIQKYAENSNLTESDLFDDIKRNYRYYEEVENEADDLPRVKKFVRGTKIFVPKDLKGDFNGTRKDGYNAFRLEHFGHFILTTNEAAHAMGIDVLYGDLNDQFPELFPSDVVNPADQLRTIGDVMSAADDIEYRVSDYDDGTVQEVVDAIQRGIAQYSEVDAQRYFEKQSKERLAANEYAPAEDIAPVAEQYEAVRPKPSKEPRMARVKEGEDIAPLPTYETARKDQLDGQRTMFPEGKIAEVLTEEPETAEKKVGVVSKLRTHIFDKQSAIEDLALKTRNRELMGKANFMLSSESRAQNFIGKGKDGVRALTDLRTEVENAGLEKDFGDYMYHKHNVDRMSLESKAQATLAKLKSKFGHLKIEQMYAIAAKEITDKTTERTAQTIREAKEYLNALEAKNKPVFADSITAEVSQQRVAEFEKAHPEFKRWAKDVYAINEHLRGMLVDAGVISQETAELWATMYPNYVPIRRDGKNGAAINVPLDTNRTGVDAPIKRATGGNSDILPLFNTLATRVEQTFRAVAKNNFGIELKNTLGAQSISQKATVDDVLDSFDNHDELLQKGENGGNPTFTVFEDGQRVTFEITEELYDALRPVSDAMQYQNKVLGGMSNLQRGLLTEYNPVFLATNMLKDVQDVLLNSQHAAKTYANMPVAFKELLAKGKWYQEYMENGGSDLTYFDGKKKTFTGDDTGIKKIIGIPLRGISAANNFIERLPRLAEYIASRKKGASVEVAMLDAARVTTNFAAGGDFTKMLNRNGFTFLNASVQGFNQQVRNIREAKANGVKGVLTLAAKFAAAGLPALLLNHLLWEDDEEYEDLSDYVKDSYYIIAKTEDGKFIRIPKGRAMAVIQNGFTQMENLVTGNDEVDLARFGQLLVENLAPNNPLDNNVFAPLMQAASNKTWYGEELVPTRLQDLPAAEQFDETTDSLSKWLGETTGISPYKINYVLNQYSGGVGDVFLPMMTPKAESGDNSFKGNLLAPWKDKFVTDSVLKNQNVSDFYDTVDELAKNANSMYATDEDTLKYKYMNSVNADLGELYQQKREIQNSDLPDDEKYDAVREVQRQIDELSKEALSTYNNVSVDGIYATVGDRHYRWYEPSEDSEAEAGWQKITDKQLEKQENVTGKLGISASQYWSNKEEYDYAYDYPEKYAVAKSVGGYKAFRQYSSELYDIKADKDEDGKSISGSRKEKVLDYINALDADYGTKIILFKSEYNADDTYNYDIIDYLNSRKDISYSEMVTILKELGFTVHSDGRVTWD